MTGIETLRSCAERHLRDYTDPRKNYAFTAYDRQGDPNRLEPVDCLAPVLLNVPLRSRDVVQLFRPEGGDANLLEAMQAVLDDPDCTIADFLDISLDATAGPWERVDQAVAASEYTPRVKAVAVTKILHRKRPYLVPIFDRHVYRFYTGKFPPNGAYGETPRRFWLVLQADLRSQREWLTELASHVQTPDCRPLSPLRAADIVIWSHESTECESVG